MKEYEERNGKGPRRRGQGGVNDVHIMHGTRRALGPAAVPCGTPLSREELSRAQQLGSSAKIESQKKNNTQNTATKITIIFFKVGHLQNNNQ